MPPRLRCCGWAATDRATRCAQDKWSAAFSVRTVLVSLQSLLGGASAVRQQPVLPLTAALAADPNNDSPLNTFAAQLWDDQESASALPPFPCRPLSLPFPIFSVCVVCVRVSASRCTAVVCAPLPDLSAEGGCCVLQRTKQPCTKSTRRRRKRRLPRRRPEPRSKAWRYARSSRLLSGGVSPSGCH
eukprot:COSAG04_NODE_720_length_10812_cov_2.903108_4_plen_186_part_00